MDPERWGRVGTLFTAIADHPEADWPRLLDRLCGCEDSADRREVERMLDADRRSTDLLDRPAARLSGAAPPSGVATANQTSGDNLARVGSYRLLHPIGLGAMSVVYLAVRDDDAYHQRVAIKVIRPEIEDPSAIRRFLAERQILAGLEHPNIARLYGGGETEDGRPYLAMEYVDGEPITDYCDRRQLDIEARLHLFLDVCGAVQHAHQSLLVHRDLKPGNILVTTDGTVKLLDFGIAKLLAPREGVDPRTTQTGYRPMTPSYASPEQIRSAAITTATDVYSLGVLLFELLTGLRPYRLTTNLPHELELAICDHEPRSPSGAFAASSDDEPSALHDRTLARDGSEAELRRHLRGDLDTIVARALRKEPERRYPSARQLAADIERHLDDRPILARQDHVGYRLGKFMRRHRTILAVASVAAIVVFTLSIIVGQQADMLESQQLSTARITNLFFERLTTDDPDPDTEQIIPRQALDVSLAEIAPRLGDDRLAFAELLETMGWVYRRAGLTEDARWLFEESLDQHRLAGDDNSAMAGGQHALGALLVGSGDLAGGEVQLRQAVALHRGAAGGVTYSLAEALESLGKHRWMMGDLDEAQTLISESLEVKRRVCQQAAWTARAVSDLAWLLLERQRFTEAAPLLKEAANLREHLSATHREAVRDLEDRAVLDFARGEILRAEVLFEQSVAARRERFGDLDSSVLTGLLWQARTLIPQGRDREAVELLREALSIHGHLELGDGPLLARVLKHLGLALAGAGEAEAGEALLRKVIEAEAGWLSPNHPHVAVSRLMLGEALHNRGDLPGAESQYRRAAADLADQPEWEFGIGSEPRIALANLLIERGDVTAAQTELLRAQDILQETHPSGHWRISLTESLLGSALARVGRIADSKPLLASGLSGLELALGSNAPRSLTAAGRVDELRRVRTTPRHQAGTRLASSG